MSAYIVDLTTIHAIVHAALTDDRRYGPLSYYWDGRRYAITSETADETGEVLIRENVRSVRHRYPGDSADDLPGRVDCEWAKPYVYPSAASFRWPKPAISFVMKQLDCLEYQSCETDDWPQSRAYAICDGIRRSLIHSLPGYEAAPWGLDEYPMPAAERKTA